MVDVTGSDNIGGVNQTAVNDFTDFAFWFEWIEFTNTPTNLSEAGFDVSDGSLGTGTTVYNARGTDDLNGLVDDASAGTIGSDTTPDITRFGVRVSTTLTVTNSGTYTFNVLSDDGVILYVDGAQVVNDDSLHAPRISTGDIALDPGQYEIVIIYFELTGQNVLEVEIESDASGDYPTAIPLQDANVQANAGDDTVDAGQGNDIVDAGAGDDVVDGGGGRDTIDGGAGNDTLDGGGGRDTIDGGADDDTLTGGGGPDTFIVSTGADTITDFGDGNTGPIDDGNQSNNDFVDLSGFYNAATLAAVNASDADPSNDFATELGMLRRDAADGTVDGIIEGTDYSAQIGDIDLTIENGGAPVSGSDLTSDTVNVVCFTPGTRIETPTGPICIEDLRPGDLVRTQAQGDQPVRWIGSRLLSAADLAAYPNLRPVRISKGALGHGLPALDLVVSPQHRILVRSVIAERMFGLRQVLVSANKLLPLDGVAVDVSVQSIEYIHVMFDAHQVVFANGALAESLFPGPQALRSLPQGAVDEIAQVFPALFAAGFEPDPAVFIPNGRKQRKLIARHLKNQHALVD